MEAIAKTKYLKGSPRKARLVIDLVRGKNVSQALAILKFTNKRAADPIAKCLRSAIANATYKAEQENIAIDPDDLWIKSCFVDVGPTKNRRRLRPAPQGRAFFERRHFCHITIEVTSEQPEKKDQPGKPKKAADGKKKAEAKSPKAAPKAKTAKKAEAKEETAKPSKEAKTEKAGKEAKPKAPSKPKAETAAKEAKPAGEKAPKTEAGKAPKAPAKKKETKAKDSGGGEASSEEE